MFSYTNVGAPVKPRLVHAAAFGAVNPLLGVVLIVFTAYGILVAKFKL